MPQLRSSQTTEGRRAAPARSLWRAAGVDDRDFGKPIVAIVNSYSQFVPGHVHLRGVADIVAEAVRKAGGIPREMNTIAVDDGIAMGHDGMLYSLPSRDLIADSIEYVVEAHKVDAMVCISNCDKITPGMSMATMRLNLPTVLVSGGPMEAGKAPDGRKIDLIDTMVASMDPTRTDDDVAALEASSCPTCGSCSGMFTANSMNCLAEALGLALPGNGTLLATHSARRALFERAGSLVVELARRWYRDGDARALPRGIATPAAFRNAMSVDIAMGGSTNTILHLLAMAREGAVDFDLAEIDRLSRRVPYLCKVAPATSDFHIEDVHRAGGIPAILGELAKADLLEPLVPTVHSPSLAEYLREWDIGRSDDPTLERFYRAAPGGARTVSPMCHDTLFADLDRDREAGCIRSVEHAYSRDGGLAVLSGSLAVDGAIVKTGGVPEGMLIFSGPAQVFESQEAVVAGILNGDVAPGTAIVVRYEGPKGGPGMQEMLHPTTYLKARGLADSCALITDGRFSGGSAGLSIGHVSPEAAERGAIALVRDGDLIEIDIPNRRLDLNLSQEDLAARSEEKDRTDGPFWRATGRTRRISMALELYSRSVTSASDGAVRSLARLGG